MIADELIAMFSERKKLLESTYQGDDRKQLPLSKQHQIYGAMSELDLVLEVLQFSKTGDSSKLDKIMPKATIKKPLRAPKPNKRQLSIQERIMEFVDDSF